MDRIMMRLSDVAARRARMRRILAAARLREDLPPDVAVSETEDAVVIEGRRLGMRWLRDPRFAILRDPAGWLR